MSDLEHQEDAAPAHAPGDPEAEPVQATDAAVAIDEAERQWFWCPNCLLVSERAGTCPGCRTPFVPAPHSGIPYGPYRPKLESGRRAAAVVLGAIGTLAVIGAAALGFYLLFNHGKPLNDTTAEDNAGVTTYALPSLGVSVALPGVWTSDDSLQQVALDNASVITGGRSGVAEITARRGATGAGEVFTVVTVQMSNPGSVLDSNLNPAPISQTTSDGSRQELSAAKRTTIAHHNAVINDLEVHSAAGALVTKARFYIIDARDHVVIMELEASGSQASTELPGLIQAVTALH